MPTTQPRRRARSEDEGQLRDGAPRVWLGSAADLRARGVSRTYGQPKGTAAAAWHPRPGA